LAPVKRLLPVADPFLVDPRSVWRLWREFKIGFVFQAAVSGGGGFFCKVFSISKLRRFL
jgi:hypothetical protein